MDALTDWCKCAWDETPAEDQPVWTTDGRVVRQGVWHWGGPGIPLDTASWKDLDGAEIKVTHWRFLAESPDGPPELTEDVLADTRASALVAQASCL